MRDWRCVSRVGLGWGIALAFSACLEFRTDDKPFLCEQEPCPHDAGADAGPERDGGADAGPHAGGSPDAGSDAGGDAGTDAGADAGSDAGSDAGRDAGSGSDAGTDAGSDGGSGADAGPDAGRDAGPDAGTDAGATVDGGLFINAEGSWRRLTSPLDASGDFGASVALSWDERTLVVGAPTFQRGPGAFGSVAVYRVQGVQLTLLTTLAPPGADTRFGASVAVNADGKRVLVGSPGDVGDAGGSAWLFIASPDGGYTARVVGAQSARPTGARFGASVAYAAFTDRFAVGSPDGLPTAGGVRSGTVEVFSFDGGPVASEFVIDDARVGAQDGFGESLGLNFDGTTLIAGAPGDDSLNTSNTNAAPDSGMALVFVRTGSSWSRQWIHKAGAARAGGAYGHCVALDGLGSAAVLAGANASAEMDFDVQLRSFSVWGAGLNGRLPITSTPGPGCAMSGNGDWAVGSHDGLIALIPTRPPGVARQLATPSAAGSTLGRALSTNPDASVVVMGEPGAGNAGAVWVLWR